MSISSVWDELWGLIAADPDQPASSDPIPILATINTETNEPQVRIVYRGEPVKGYEQSGTWIAITPGGYSSDYVSMWLRVYRTVGERPIQDQQLVCQVVEIIETLLDTQDRFEMADWTIGQRPNLGDWVAEALLRGPRE